MLRDIENRDDIDSLMRLFYARAMSDDMLGHIFTDVAKLDLEHHLPIIGDFWETMLFRGGDYARHGRNPMQVHRDLDQKTPLLPHHFDRWLEIFDRATDDLFAGETSAFLKMRTRAIAGRMLEFVAGGEPRFSRQPTVSGEPRHR